MEIIEALGNIGFDWRIAVANFINFVIIYWLLNKFVFKQLTATLEERRNKIEEGLQLAKDAQVIKEKANNEREEILRSARSEATEIIAQAKSKQETIVAESADKARAEADKIITESKTKATNEIQEARRKFSNEAAGLVVKATEKLLRKNLDNPNVQTATAKTYLADLQNNHSPLSQKN